jgi:two-component system response regulator MprA
VSRGVTMRVLVVEDEPSLARFLLAGLEQEGYSVAAAPTAAAALARVGAGPFDLILLDWMLPDQDGLSLCRALRSEGDRTAIVMLTARDAVTDRVMGLDSGADDYVTKPFEFEELLARIRSVLRRTGAGRSPQLVVGDLLLDPAAHTVRRGGREIHLTAREFGLLECLMRHAGQTLTRRDLLRHVWGYDHDPQTNIVDVYVGYLRRKIERDAGPTLLHAVAGVGYRLGASR